MRSLCPLLVASLLAVAWAQNRPRLCFPGHEYNRRLRSCQPCPIGTYQQYFSTTPCTRCPLGTTTTREGTTSRWQCFRRDSGFEENTTPWIFQPRISTARNQRPSDCGPGCFFNETSKQCQLCPVGGFQPYSGRLSCFACPRGTSTPGVGAIEFSECRALGEIFTPTVHPFPRTATNLPSASECSPGCFFNLTTQQCQQCPVGEYQPYFGRLFCFPCPRGYTTEYPAAVTVSECSVHDTGELSTSGVETDHRSDTTAVKPNGCGRGSFFDETSKRCRSCPVGTYQPYFRALSCLSCPRETTTFDVGATSIYECFEDHFFSTSGVFATVAQQSPMTTPFPSQSPEDCEPGYFYNISRHCQQCKIGYYQPDAAQQFCYSCPRGVITPVLGATDVEQCNIPAPKLLCGEAVYEKCQNGGTCLELDQRATCLCRPSWTGSNCEEYRPNTNRGFLFYWQYSFALIPVVFVVLFSVICCFRCRNKPNSLNEKNSRSLGEVKKSQRTYQNKQEQEPVYRVSSKKYDPPPSYPSLPPRRLRPSTKTQRKVEKNVSRSYQTNRSRKSSLKLSGLKNKPTKAASNVYLYT